MGKKTEQSVPSKAAETKAPIKMYKNEDTFNLIVKKSLEDKIRYLCARFQDKEYSGALFYTTEGEVGTPEFIVICKDFCLCDIGSSTYTEFETRPEVVTYMCDNDLLDCYIGLMHSHNKMATWFSGTDISTLNSEGSSMPHFVSLIVNNEGTYTAAITTKVTRTFKGTVTENKLTFGNNVLIEDSMDKEFTDTCLFYNYLNVHVERDPWFSDVEGKIDDITNRKKSKKVTDIINHPTVYPSGMNKEPAFKQLQFFDTEDADENDNFNVYSTDFGTDGDVDLISNPTLCSTIVKKALFLDSKKAVLNKTVDDAIVYYTKQKLKLTDRTLKQKLTKALKESVTSGCGDTIMSAAAANLVNDITLYVDTYESSRKKSLTEMQDEADALSDVFDAAVDLISY